MRTLLSLLLVLGSMTLSFAQITYAPTTVVVQGVLPTDFQRIGYARVDNPSNDTISVRWIREIIALSDGWETAGCDRNFCYEPSVDSEQFDLFPGDTSSMNVYVYPRNQAGSAIVRMRIVNLTNPQDTLVATYYFNENPVSVSNPLLLPELMIYPNPVPHSFRLSDAVESGSIELYNMQGERLRSWRVQPGYNYPVADLPPAVYSLQLLGERGQPVARQVLVKQ